MNHQEQSGDKRKLIEIWKENKSYSGLGNYYWISGNTEKAVKMFRKSASKLENWARNYDRENDKFSAMDRYIEAAEMYENSAKINKALKCYYRAKKIAEELRPHIEKAGGNYLEVSYDNKVPKRIKSLEKRLVWIKEVTRPSDKITLSNLELLKNIRVLY